MSDISDKFSPGTVVFHLATGKKCVVVEVNIDKTVKVETQDDTVRDYAPTSLITAEEKRTRAEEENRRIMSQMPKNDKDWGIS